MNSLIFSSCDQSSTLMVCTSHKFVQASCVHQHTTGASSLEVPLLKTHFWTRQLVFSVVFRRCHYNSHFFLSFILTSPCFSPTSKEAYFLYTNLISIPLCALTRIWQCFWVCDMSFDKIEHYNQNRQEL